MYQDQKPYNPAVQEPYPPNQEPHPNPAPCPPPYPDPSLYPPQYYQPQAINSMNSHPAVIAVAQVPVTYKDYLGLSIFTLICCCWPIGIAAVVFSCKTRDSMARGDMTAASSESRTAFVLNMVALGIGIAVNIIWIALVIYYTTLFYSVYSSNYYG